MSTPSLDDLQTAAIQAARAAGAHAQHNKHRRNERIATTAHDVKLRLDVECQEIAEATLHHLFPHHDVLGEESEERYESSTYQWIIDPIDGTTNYAHGNPYWCSSVAVRLHGNVLAGCVFAPEFDACYAAHTETSATKNGHPLHCSFVDQMDDALVFSGLSPEMETPNHPHFELFRQLIYSSRKLRINGAAALDLCQLAEGHADAYLEMGLYLWDHAAALLIAQQAGALATLFPRENLPYGTRVICANPKLHSTLLELYQRTIDL